MLFAVFDVDRTLIKEDSLLLAARFANNKFNFFKNILIFLPIYLISKLGFIEQNLKKISNYFNVCELFNNQEKNLYKEKLIKALDPKLLKE